MYHCPNSGKKVIVLYMLVYLLGCFAIASTVERETPIVRAVKKAGSAVVNISTTEIIKEHPFYREFGGFWFDFNPFFLPRQPRQTLGSGVIIDQKGYILTNSHLLLRASKIVVSTVDENVFDAELVSSSEKFDIAVLKIDPEKHELHSLPMGDSSDLMVGETVIAIGNPFGFSHTVTSGIVSALNRTLDLEGNIYRDLIQTDCPINPGNSGGPLLNINGELIGINTAIRAGAENIGFAIDINKAKRIVNDLLRFGETRYPWFGFFVHDLTPSLAEYFHYDGKTGVLILSLLDDSPAAKAKLKEEDIIISIGKFKVQSVEDYKSIVAEFSIGEEVDIKYFRKGKTYETTITGTEFPDKMVDKVSYEWLGMKVADNSTEMMQKYGLPNRLGVVITEVKMNSRTFRRNIKPGMIIHKVNNIKITSKEDYDKAIKEAVKRNMDEIMVILQYRDTLYRLTLS